MKKRRRLALLPPLLDLMDPPKSAMASADIGMWWPRGGRRREELATCHSPSPERETVRVDEGGYDWRCGRSRPRTRRHT